jgi:hypothetical protein
MVSHRRLSDIGRAAAQRYIHMKASLTGRPHVFPRELQVRGVFKLVASFVPTSHRCLRLSLQLQAELVATLKWALQTGAVPLLPMQRDASVRDVRPPLSLAPQELLRLDPLPTLRGALTSMAAGARLPDKLVQNIMKTSNPRIAETSVTCAIMCPCRV